MSDYKWYTLGSIVGCEHETGRTHGRERLPGDMFQLPVEGQVIAGKEAGEGQRGSWSRAGDLPVLKLHCNYKSKTSVTT